MGMIGAMMGKLRCPHCASYERHFRDKVAEASTNLANAQMQQLGFPDDFQRPTPRAFVCRSCGHRFGLDAAMTWARIAKKLGDERTTREYAEVSERSATSGATGESAE